MNKVLGAEYLTKFPAVLRTKLANKEIIFPDGIQFIYEPVWAYRVVVRNIDDNTPLCAADMKSYYELGKKPRGKKNCESDPEFYAVSLSKTKKYLKQCNLFPKPNKKLAQGYIHKEGGPQYTDSNDHINWWLYENADISGFVIKEDFDE